ncbi:MULTISPECIES: septum site-determining protein MinC [Pseudomonas]|uniref:Probable septum site-determining protein MinC n=1 Tax=Pseudomonas nitroreducens TaxID=46680 RepID=A0A6G6J191_PSENT|nr:MULTISPECIES: septum site-determining protein MinC [Pseudomonas]MBG6289744.1 septum site-determining protein MinC [Pseudomonas nitroreducens]MCJ1880544.1 septum site-determining protein MinC [Pseudomonas nitroreducens]MCJ1898684.1 septum site-determining protein MinC [Pseudomonas nitroreducens]MDG9853033.1 septum site-determining protein MinC [Pseudomonas nitroreducens]MDH1073197.1 septum site-determining protein MinC [Pseudomonas nitroreducens]
MSQADLLDHDPVFQLKGSMLAVTVLELAHNDLPRLDRQLADKVAQAPNFFRDTPLVLALDKLPDGEGQLDLQGVLDICRRHGLRTLAIRASREEDIRLATMFDIPVLPPSGSSRERPVEPKDAVPQVTGAAPVRRPRGEKLSEKVVEQAAGAGTQAEKPAAPGEPIAAAQPAAEAQAPTQEAAAEKPAEPPAPVVRPTKLVTTPVRGGVQIYAAGGDLIVLAPVSPGAELLADGNIHVYGPMRGRALAGVKGDTSARIFCQQLAAELVSIAGNYKVAEDLRRSPQWGQAVHVSLSGDVLNITRL